MRFIIMFFLFFSIIFADNDSKINLSDMDKFFFKKSKIYIFAQKNVISNIDIKNEEFTFKVSKDGFLKVKCEPGTNEKPNKCQIIKNDIILSTTSPQSFVIFNNDLYYTLEEICGKGLLWNIYQTRHFFPSKSSKDYRIFLEQDEIPVKERHFCNKI